WLNRIGRISTERRSRSCASPQSASCSENSAIQREVSGRTLRFWQRDRDAGVFACEDLLAFEVAAIGESFEAFCLQCRLRLIGHVRELRLVGADVGHLMRDDQ